LKPLLFSFLPLSNYLLRFKNQNPREGIETLIGLDDIHDRQHTYLQKTKIPARGLKLETTTSGTITYNISSSKNQNPREGIETPDQHQDCQDT